MKALKILGVIIIPFLIMFMVAAFWKCAFNHYYHLEDFPTYNAAGGFLPGFTPPSATDIRYIHATEAPDMWLFFNFNIEEIPKIRQYCGMPVHGEIKLAPRPPRYVIDWPEEITGDAPVNAEDIADYEFYRCRGDSVATPFLLERDILAVDAKKGKAYYWGTY